MERHILLIEDSDRDAALVALNLRRGGIEARLTRVQTAEEMVARLETETFDAVVCDYNLPQFSAPEALEIFKSHGLDIPFIVVSATVGEETAVDLMRTGAHDYLMKDRLVRLGAAIEHQIAQSKERRAKRRAETLFQAVLRATPDASVIVDRETLGTVEWSQSFAKQFMGDRPLERKMSLLSVVEFSQPERITQLVARGSGTAWYCVYYVDSIAHVANIRCHSVDHESRSYAYIVIEDVTEQHYLKAAFDAVEDVILIIGSDQRLLYASRSAESLFGTLYFGMNVETLLDRPALEPRWWQRATQRFEERRIVINDQPYEAMAVTFRFAGETESSTILTLRNISEEEELIRLATHDALTGIYNVRHFSQVLPQQISMLNNGEESVLVLLDLDHFKPINDQMGHAAGDAALITFASVVRSEIHATDIFARLGGDEFALLLPHRSIDDASDVIRRIYERLARTPLRFDGLTRPLGTSCGITRLHQGDLPSEARERADRALYEAKRTGRGRFVVASEERRSA